MWNPDPRWQQQGSFVEPVVPPAAHPGDAPLVCLSLNADWLPYLVGAALQLAQPSSWLAADDAARAAVLLDAQDLIFRIGAAGACEVLSFRCSGGVSQFSTDGGATWTTLPSCLQPRLGRFDPATCQLQESTDNGATWTEVSGWDGIGLCIEAGGGSGGTGPFGPVAPPPNPFGHSAATQGCNIAGFLAHEVIQLAISQAVTSFNAAQSFLQFLTNFEVLLAAAVGVGVVAGLILDAAVAIYGYYTAGTIADFTAAASDATLWGDVTCAINGAISADGYVTPGNFPNVLTALAGVSYAHAEVVSAIHDFVAGLGYAGVHSLQIPGALASYDCSGCGGGGGGLPCGSFDGATDFVTLPDSLFSTTPPGTVTAWVKVADVAHAYCVLGGGIVATRELIRVPLVFNDRIAAQLAVAAGAQDLTESTTTTLDTGWHHVAVASSGTAWTLWIDGILQGTAQVVGTNVGAWFAGLGPGAYHVDIGASYDSGVGMTALFKGLMYDVAVWSGVLTTIQVQSVKSAGPGGASVPGGSLLGWWRFSEGAGSTVADSSGAGHNGTWAGTGVHWATR